MTLIKCSYEVLSALNLKAIFLLPQSLLLCIFVYLLQLHMLHLLHHRFNALFWGCWLWVALVRFKLRHPVSHHNYEFCQELFLNIVSDKCFHGRQIMCWLMISYWRKKKKKNLPCSDKIFMMYLEQIPSCIRLCNWNVEQSEKKAGALCCSLQRCRRQMLATSKLQWGRWQCQLLNCAEEWKLQAENRVFEILADVCLFARFLCWHLMAAAI